MSTIKSFAVGNGDMFYIDHNSDNFTVIDCCLTDDKEDEILTEIANKSGQKGITRVISTHPDDDHLRGLERLDKKTKIVNFYCVRNAATKSYRTTSFEKYCELRDSEKAFHISKGCSRKWMNLGDADRDPSGISILWPDCNNQDFKDALLVAEDGGSPNNISAVIQYSLNDGVTALWMGDLETDFMESIEDELDLPHVHLLFAPHHGRDSGKIPKSMLTKMNPKIIIVGEAPSKHLHYYPGYDTITQNSAGDIVFECVSGKVHVFTSNAYYVNYLVDEQQRLAGYHYLGTLDLKLD